MLGKKFLAILERNISIGKSGSSFQSVNATFGGLIETDLDITNGARGTIVGIVLHPDEPPCNNSTVSLQQLPSLKLIEQEQETFRLARWCGIRVSQDEHHN